MNLNSDVEFKMVHFANYFVWIFIRHIFPLRPQRHHLSSEAANYYRCNTKMRIPKLFLDLVVEFKTIHFDKLKNLRCAILPSLVRKLG